MRDDVFKSIVKRTLNTNRFDLVSGLNTTITARINDALGKSDINSQLDALFAIHLDNVTSDASRTIMSNNFRNVEIVLNDREISSLDSQTLLLLGYTGLSLEAQLQVPPSAVFQNNVNVNHGGQVPTYTGSDMQVFAITPHTFSLIPTMKVLSYSTHVDKTFVRVLGRSIPKGHSDGFRTIAGSMIHTISVNDPLMPLHPEWINGDISTVHNIQDLWRAVLATDQLPSFDLLIFFTNEVGFASTMAIFGIQIPDTGQTISMSDSEIEISYTYTALDIDIMRGTQYRKNSVGIGKNKQDIYTLDIIGMNEYLARRNRILNGYSLHTSPFEAPALWAKMNAIYEEVDFAVSSRQAKDKANLSPFSGKQETAKYTRKEVERPKGLIK